MQGIGLDTRGLSQLVLYVIFSVDISKFSAENDFVSHA